MNDVIRRYQRLSEAGFTHKLKNIEEAEEEKGAFKRMETYGLPVHGKNERF